MRFYVPATLAQEAVNKVLYIRSCIENYNTIGPNACRRSTSDLLEFCCGHLDRKINLLEHSSTHLNHKIISFFVKYDDHYDVVYLRDLNKCWKRFAICKELFHAILDDPSNCNPNVANHVNSMFAIEIAREMTREGGATDMENVAEIAAGEYLFPYSERKRILANKSIDYSAIAQQFLIPRYYVELLLNEQSMTALGNLSYKNSIEIKNEDD